MIVLLIVLVVICLIANGVRSERPAKQPPTEMLDGYTVNGSIPMASFYIDDTNGGRETHYVFTEKNIENYLKGTRKTFDRIQDYDNIAPMKQPKNDWIFYAAKKYEAYFINSSVVIFGSTEPYVEAAALELAARHVTAVEYNNLTYMHEQISTISKFRFKELYACGGTYQNAFDIALSISSFDHDGLGRYGDPLDPNGDLKAMSRAMGVLKPGGLLIMTVPIGPDLVVWNLLRRYGSIRLRMLLQGWEVVEKLFWEESKLTTLQPNFRQSYEPILVIRKPLNASGWLCDEEREILDGEMRGAASAPAMPMEQSIHVSNEEL